MQEGKALHRVPYYGDERPEPKKRRKRWVDFVKQKRAKSEPLKFSVICSQHFKPEDVTRLFANVDGGQEEDVLQRWLKKDDLGVCVFPTIHTVGTASKEKPKSDREKRMARFIASYFLLYFRNDDSCLSTR